MAHTQNELNRCAWTILVNVAQEHDYITYKDLANRINRLIGTKYSPKNIGQNALDLIERFCLKQRLPDLTALVVEQQSEIPGKDFFAANKVPTELSVPALRYQWTKIRDQVWQTAWPESPPSEW